MKNIIKNFKNIKYGPAPEDDKDVLKWIKNLSSPNRIYINGKWTLSKSSKTLQAINPSTNSKLFKLVVSSKKDVDSAVIAANKAYPKWSKLSSYKRSQYLYALARLIQKHARFLSVLESIDNGKPIRETRDIDIPLVARHFYYHAGWAAKSKDTVKSLGVVGQIIPWNFPLLMLAWKIAPAIACGNTVVLKPAEYTSLTAIFFAELCMKAKLPNGVINIVTGDGSTGQHITNHPLVKKIAFTGSTEVGGLFMKYSGESNLKTIGLEMGGKSPFLVLEDAKINDTLIDNAINSAFWNGGQNCSANMRQIIHSKVKDEFLDKVLKRVKNIKVGDPLDTETNMGSMISKGHLAKVDGYIQKGIDEGASILHGGVSDGNQKGFFAKPTLFDNVKENMTIAQEEIFGPVLGVMTVNNENEALNIAKNSKYGLHASVFTQDINKAFHLAKSLPCGTVSVNTFSEGDIKVPFGGYKQSGSLSRDQGTEALNQYLQTKTIWISHS